MLTLVFRLTVAFEGLFGHFRDLNGWKKPKLRAILAGQIAQRSVRQIVPLGEPAVVSARNLCELDLGQYAPKSFQGKGLRPSLPITIPPPVVSQRRPSTRKSGAPFQPQSTKVNLETSAQHFVS
jgi:hypothetical protein